ncbi:hypothetical protein [Streptomyces roseicoloratus]|uniref:Uncharacterized protein n=1 Tax=Streptomyces roseicoloratus TaxID=2508722 RepID=A0ABY9RXJ9_9ACTN|nr:hypothetical protein [Streptomyces roseicoloratus]WMX46893.1 hypothetical protein RGF97_21590 [Streptomyces roseicoloratus]
MSVRAVPPTPKEPPPGPVAGEFVADVSNGVTRLGRVTRHESGSVYVRPVGGGAEWAVSPGNLRPPTEGEWASVRILANPVPPVLVLSADHELRPRPVPVPGCTACAHLVQWFDRYMGTGPQHDESAAVDCVVEIRNHPHDPPKMRIVKP